MGNESHQNKSKETVRLEAFSDGVFAIAATLLVLDIHVPDVKADQSLLQAIMSHWTNHIAFLIGFFTILICWINHHYMFEYIQKSDSGLLLMNGFKLLVVTFTPFVTAVLSKYINTPQQPVAVSIYAFNFLLMGLAMFLICRYASREKYVRGSRQEEKALVQLYAFAAVFSAIIFVVSFATTFGALVLACIMFLIFLFPGRAFGFLMMRSGPEQAAHVRHQEVLQEVE
ncbi:MAG TPA: TMEM175 family protein [Chitinophagaceae bacterium]|nr:TMEM175 family protein [Chitinophagaceae bacterium]